MSNLDLQIGTFQIKYVEYTGDWDTTPNANTVLAIGEPVMLLTNSNTLFYLYLGDGVHTLRQLDADKKFIQLGGYIQPPGLQSNITRVKSDGSSNSAGTSNAYARADHQHTLDRKISYGTDIPTGGNVGDIYILYEIES